MQSVPLAPLNSQSASLLSRHAQNVYIFVTFIKFQPINNKEIDHLQFRNTKKKIINENTILIYTLITFHSSLVTLMFQKMKKKKIFADFCRLICYVLNDQTYVNPSMVVTSQVQSRQTPFKS